MNTMQLAMTLLAAPQKGFPIGTVLTIILLAIGLGLIFGILSRYRRCPSNRVLVIYGKTGSGAARCVHGGAAFIWPLFQAYDYLDLEPFDPGPQLPGLPLGLLELHLELADGTGPDLGIDHGEVVLVVDVAAVEHDAHDFLAFSRDLRASSFCQSVMSSARVDDVMPCTRSNSLMAFSRPALTDSHPSSTDCSWRTVALSECVLK